MARLIRLKLIGREEFAYANPFGTSYSLLLQLPRVVYCFLNPLGFVAFKMGRRQGGPSRTGGKRAHI
jgi:hypothetical protein